MGLDYDISTNEQEFVLEALKQNVRLDGRKLLDMRDVKISILPSEYGHVEVSLGKTRVACKVSAEIVKPYEDRPFEGIFQINTEISPMCSPFFEIGQGSSGSGSNSRQANEEVLISRMIEKAVRRSNALDIESLCIVAGSKCWAVRADLHFLNYDGNFIDASCIAVMTALLHFRKPDIEVAGEEVVVYDTNQREPVPLSILHVPICITFNFYNPNGNEENVKGELNNELILADASLIEERLSLGTMTITLNKNQEICQLLKSGGLNIDASLIMNCCLYASKLVSRLNDEIHEVLKEDSKKRRNVREEKELQVFNERES
ncbi:DEKNAAC102809 [Brettanomyces naardenensis]|uniref:Exosome complex component RRP45 n=1 Tax=Brettanomyces naardenensis TaxID=13370 RepID=A0A448YLT4_BRENA|nr:DEKNAAC102809 [Brettanomyces naardenensis]